MKREKKNKKKKKKKEKKKKKKKKKKKNPYQSPKDFFGQLLLERVDFVARVAEFGSVFELDADHGISVASSISAAVYQVVRPLDLHRRVHRRRTRTQTFVILERRKTKLRG